MPSRTRRFLPAILGILLIGGGLAIVGNGLIQKYWLNPAVADARAANDQGHLNAWIKGAPAASGGAALKTCAASSTGNDYALVRFSSLSYGYADVAVDGNWDNLHDRSMVHWHGSADPGGQGNVIIAFHREPNFQHIDQLNSGGTITIQDRTCHTYVYTVSAQWQGAPEKVTQLVTTQAGHTLTMITCTPWWVDNNRIVWSANLTSIDGKAFSG
jgi:LPXTG-site transpeptidase (sortase) family protein